MAFIKVAGVPVASSANCACKYKRINSLVEYLLIKRYSLARFCVPSIEIGRYKFHCLTFSNIKKKHRPPQNLPDGQESKIQLGNFLTPTALELSLLLLSHLGKKSLLGNHFPIKLRHHFPTELGLHYPTKFLLSFDGQHRMNSGPITSQNLACNQVLQILLLVDFG